MRQRSEVRAALDESQLDWARRLVWLIAVGTYLTVFIGGIRGGGDELMTVGKAAAFTLVAALLGSKAIGLLSRASLPEEQGRSADQAGPVGSLVELVASTNVANQEDEAAAAV
jgi:hypothetical protein